MKILGLEHTTSTSLLLLKKLSHNHNSRMQDKLQLKRSLGRDLQDMIAFQDRIKILQDQTNTILSNRHS